MNNNKISGVKIRELRQNKGLSQSKLSDLSAINQSKLSAWELGKEMMDLKTYNEIISLLKNIKKSEIDRIIKKRINRSHQSEKILVPKRSFIKTKRNSEYAVSLYELLRSYSNQMQSLKKLKYLSCLI